MDSICNDFNFRCISKDLGLKFKFLSLDFRIANGEHGKVKCGQELVQLNRVLLNCARDLVSLANFIDTYDRPQRFIRKCVYKRCSFFVPSH